MADGSVIVPLPWLVEVKSLIDARSARKILLMVYWLIAAVPQVCLVPQAANVPDIRHRARGMVIVVGRYPPGKLNAITDVAGIMVGQTTIVKGTGELRVGEGPVRTGVTAVFSRKDVWANGVFAATHTFNGVGEMTGTHWIHDLETLNYAILLTNTGSVGGVMDAVTQYTAGQMRLYPPVSWNALRSGRNSAWLAPAVFPATSVATSSLLFPRRMSFPCEVQRKNFRFVS